MMAGSKGRNDAMGLGSFWDKSEKQDRANQRAAEDASPSRCFAVDPEA